MCRSDRTEVVQTRDQVLHLDSGSAVGGGHQDNAVCIPFQQPLRQSLGVASPRLITIEQGDDFDLIRQEERCEVRYFFRPPPPG